MKKVLSLVLVIAMVLSSFSMAFAAPKFEDIANSDYSKAIDTLVALGVIRGYEDGTFRPERVVTRAEMAVLMVQLLGYGDLVAGSKSNFSDTQGHWADAWIALAAGRGLVIGTGDGKFTPDRTVSYDEAITMVVRGLGYTDNCNELKGTWPTNYKVKAAELKLTKDVKLVATGADRGGVAQLMFNALEAALVSVDTDGNVTTLFDAETVVVDNKSITVQVVRPLLSRLATKETKTIETANLDKKSKSYLGDLVDLAPYMYQSVNVYVNDDGDVVYVAKVNSDIVTGEFRSHDDSNKINVRNNAKNKAYGIVVNDDSKVKVFYNGEEVFMTEAQMEAELGNTTRGLVYADATFVLNDNDKVTAIVANKYTNALLVASEYAGKDKFAGFFLPQTDDKVDLNKVTVIGAVDSIEDIEENDVIVLYAGKGAAVVGKDTTKLTIEVVRDTVEGKITETNADGDFLINGTYYSTSLYADDDIIAVKSEGTFFLDNKGDILAFEETSASTPKDYAVITKVADGIEVGTSPDKEVIREPKITLVNKSGDKVTYEIKSTATLTLADGTSKDLLNKVGGLDNKINIDEAVVAFDTVVKYSVNSDNLITKIVLVGKDPVAKVDTTKKSFVVASNVLVFNLNSDEDAVSVVDVAKLGEEVKQLTRVENKNGEIELLYIQGLGATDTYALITSSGTMINDDDVVVQKITAYVNGEKVVYEVDANYTVTSTAINTGKLVKLNLDGNVIESIDTSVAPIGGYTYKEVVKVSGDRFQVTGGAWYTLADDAVVYVLKSTDKFDSIGDISSLRGSSVVVFDMDNDDGVVDYIFVK